MCLRKAIGVLKKETVNKLLRIAVCQKMLGKTVQMRKVGNIVKQLCTVHIAPEAECVFGSAREKMLYVATNTVKRCAAVLFQKCAVKVQSNDAARRKDRINLPIVQIAANGDKWRARWSARR